MRWMWIDRIVEFVPGDRLVAVKCISLAEEHLHDHFPARPGREPLPVMPASLILEGVAQSGGLLVGQARDFKERVVLAKISSAEIVAEAGPGSVLRYTVRLGQIGEAGATVSALIEAAPAGTSDFREAGRAELVFSHLDRSMNGGHFPSGNFVFSDAFAMLLRAAGHQP